MATGEEPLQWLSNELAPVPLKALLFYLTAVFAFRPSARRTLRRDVRLRVRFRGGGRCHHWARSERQRYHLCGSAVTLITVLAVHACITRLRYFPSIARVIEHPPRVLVAHGRLLASELRRCGLTESDLYGLLRHRGVVDLNDVRYVIFEQRGQIPVIRQTERDETEMGLVREVTTRTSGQ